MLHCEGANDMAFLSQDFIVSTTDGIEDGSSVTALSNGTFVVTWQDQGGGDGSGAAIRGRLFASDGTPIGPDFLIDTTTSGDQLFPAVTALANGFVVTWFSS